MSYSVKIKTFFILICGILFNTSLVNIGDSGIPLFYVALPLLLSDFLIKIGFQKPLYHKKFKNAFLFSFYLLLLLIIGISFHLLSAVGSFDSELKQLIARSAFILFFFLSFWYFSLNNVGSLPFIYIKNILKFFIIYGLYQYCANIYNLPLPLDFLRNNISFYLYQNIGPGGWLNTFRVFSIWSEPSFSALPIGVFFFTLISFKKNTKELLIWWLLATVYVFLTFSRLVWIVEVVLFLNIIFFKFIKFMSQKKLISLLNKARIPLILFALIISMAWVLIAPNLMQDLSSYGRSSSVVIGLRIFLEHPIIGSGMNSYESLEYLYTDNLPYYSPEKIVHNVFVGYAQQLGLIGILYSLLPIFFILSLKNIEFGHRFLMGTLFLSLGVFGGDFYYLSLSWVVLAMLASLNFNIEFNQKNGPYLGGSKIASFNFSSVY